MPQTYFKVTASSRSLLSARVKFENARERLENLTSFNRTNTFVEKRMLIGGVDGWPERPELYKLEKEKIN